MKKTKRVGHWENPQDRKALIQTNLKNTERIFKLTKAEVKVGHKNRYWGNILKIYIASNWKI